MTAQESGEIIFYFGIATIVMSLVYLYGSLITPVKNDTDFSNVIMCLFIGPFGLIAAILGKWYAIKNK